MSFANFSAAVTDVSALIFDDGDTATALIIRNTGEDTAYIGPAGVSAATGLPVASDELLALSGLVAADVLHAVCDTGESTTLVMLVKDAV